MFSNLACRQGARPALLSLPSRTGVPRSQSLVSAPENGPQFCSTLSVLASPLTPTSCRSRKPEKHEAGLGACCKRFVIKEVKMSGFLCGGGSRDSARKVWIKSIGTPERIGGIRVVGQRSSARWYGSSLAPSVGRGSTRQQRQRCPYSSKSGFGGGQHFSNSNSEQAQNSLGLFADSQRRVIKPERIIIVRHGESLGNLDESTYVHVPDWKIPLTKKGFGEGRRAGQRIKEYIGDKPLFIYTSPYLRTKQTLAGMVEAFDSNYIVGVREEPRLTEQQFGNFQNLASIVESKAERARFGRFYYRFPQGESGLDVYNRATSFIATMFRDFANENIARDDLNVIIVTHGLTLRLLVMRWFQYSIADFEETLNPQNGGFVVMERKSMERTDRRFFESPEKRQDLRHWYELTPESRAHINFREQRQFGSLWKLLSELPDEPGMPPDEFMRKKEDDDSKDED